ncbi:hypothetical protein [Brachybacterium sp. Marseille-Q7125]|uniref:hypothetical protein n=1 Tax=Brachybacterium sp. Marseille-Q7125 TaxID=2932815 RepID=UPI001FF19F1C|nr:hypothetical protein [Brachybacterium sp. Marseille-Q7125]
MGTSLRVVLLTIVLCVALIHTVPRSRSIAGALTAVLAVAAVPIMADRHRDWDAAGHHRF